MFFSRKLVGLAVVVLATAATAVSMAGSASGAATASLPSLTLTVQAPAGQVVTRLLGHSCGDYISVSATGRGGGSGTAICGRTRVSTPACYPSSCFNETFTSELGGMFACQANAQFSHYPVTVACTSGASIDAPRRAD